MNRRTRHVLCAIVPMALALAATGARAQGDGTSHGATAHKTSGPNATPPQPGDASAAAPFKPLSTTTIGLEGKVMYRVEAGGPRLIARPVDRFANVNVRIADVTDDGDAKLYDLRFIAQHAGRFDLRDALERVDGGPMAELPAAPVAVGALLDPEHDGELIAMQEVIAKPRVGYRATLIALGSVWLLVPIAYGVWRLAHRKRRVVVAPPPPPPTLADQLAPMVEAARTGRLDAAGRAALERLHIAYWRKRLRLDALGTRGALDAIKADPKAGALLNAVERWLHAPDGTHHSADEALRLLNDYRDASAIQLTDDQAAALAPTRPATIPAEVGA